MTEIINGTLRMTSDRILLAPLEWSGEDVHGADSKIEVGRRGRPLRGIVLAVGPGLHPVSRRTKLGDGRVRVDYAKRFRPTQVAVDDVVEIGGLNIFDGQGYDHPTVIYNGQRCLIIQERDVCFVDEEATERERRRRTWRYECVNPEHIAHVST